MVGEQTANKKSRYKEEVEAYKVVKRTKQSSLQRSQAYKTDTARGQPPRAVSFVELSIPVFAPLGAATKRRYRSDSTRQERRFYRYRLWNGDSENRFSLPSAITGSPTRSKSGQWRRPQCLGNPTHALAHFRFPPAIHPRELPAATGVTAIIVRQALRVPTFSLNPLWGRMLRPAIEKRLGFVQKLWTMRLPCGRLRKSAEEFATLPVWLHQIQ